MYIIADFQEFVSTAIVAGMSSLLAVFCYWSTGIVLVWGSLL